MNKITKELLDALKGSFENAEQEAFERWLADESPSGDVEQVKRQWEESSDFRDFLSNWQVELVVIAKAEAILAATQSNNEWIPWAGGDCPVNGEVIVQVEGRNGVLDTDKARLYDWYHRGGDDDIVAYRLVKP